MGSMTNLDVKTCVRNAGRLAARAALAGLGLVCAAPPLAAQTPPATPVFEATGYGVLRPFYDMYRTPMLAVRPQDAGGAAEFVTLPGWSTLNRVERWKLTSAGVPYFAGYTPVSYHPTAAAWVDVNGDGASDLVCGETSPNGLVVEVLLMRPEGLNSPGRIIPLSNFSLRTPIRYLTNADVNGDGFVDIGVVGTSSNGHSLDGMSWLLGTGDGTFTEVPGQASNWLPVAMPLVPAAPVSLVAWYPSGLKLEFKSGNGDGTFNWSDGPFYPASERPISADFDGDGFTDFVAGRFFYRGNTSGYSVLYDSVGANASALVDLDHDGRSDLVAVEDGLVRTAKGLGGFSFGPFTDVAVGDISDHGSRFEDVTGLSAVADLNGDGWADVVAASPWPLTSVLYAVQGRPGGAFFQPARLPTGAGPVQVALADVAGGDGKLDLIVLARRARQIELRAGQGNGTFGPTQSFELPAAGTRFALADLDRDGHLDLAVVCDSTPTLCVFRGTSGGFGTRADFISEFPLTDLAIADIDEDGTLDVLAAAKDGRFVGWRDLSGLAFEPASWSTFTWGDGRVRLADFDGDGHLDLCSIDRGPGGPKTLRVQRGDGHGSFDNCTLSPCGPIHLVDTNIWSGTAFEPAPLSPGGKPYVAYATADSFGYNYSFFRAASADSTGVHPIPLHCDGTPCGSREGYELPPSPHQLAVADVTGDGLPDVLSLSDLTGTLAVLPGLGEGRFGIPSLHAVGPQPVSFALGDVNGDGRPDVVVADGQNNEVLILRHLGGATADVAWTPRAQGLEIRAASAPNAAAARLRVRTDGAREAAVELFDAAGRRLARQRFVAGGSGEHDVTFDGRSLPGSGIFFARVSQGDASASVRLVRLQ